MDRVDVAVVGGGQAGLSVSHELTARGVEHVVLERGRVGQTWRERWDTFCLVTPNWTLRLPSGWYQGPDPDGFMPRDEIVEYLDGYARSTAAPVREGVDVRSIAGGDGDFALETSDGGVRARGIVLATGAYQRPHRPPAADALPRGVPQLDVADYRNPETLPAGPVLIIGSGQSGAQLAEELHASGRDVVLSCGRAPWAARRFWGRDLVWWTVETGFLAQPVDTLPDLSARLTGNILASGHGGGHDLHLRTLARDGVRLVGRFAGAEAGRAVFAADLGTSVAWGDARHADFMALCRATAAARGIDAPDEEAPAPIAGDGAASIDVRSFAAVIFAGGFRPDYRSWLPWNDAFDEWGFPLHRDGASTVVPGLWFVGVHFLRRRSSALLLGVGEDASVVAEGIATSLA